MKKLNNNYSNNNNFSCNDNEIHSGYGASVSSNNNFISAYTSMTYSPHNNNINELSSESKSSNLVHHQNNINYNVCFL